MEYKHVKEFTQCNESRIASLVSLTAQLLAYGVKGDFCEFGVWKGGACMAMARTMLETGRLRPLHLFDTFAGHQPDDFSEADVEIRLIKKGRGEIPPGTRTAQDVYEDPAYAAIGLKEVQANIQSTGFPMELAYFTVGNACHTVKTYKPEDGIALLRLDMDWYKPTKAVLERMFPAINKGGVLIVDDYGHWGGCKQAVDEYLVGPYEDFPGVMIDDSCLVVWVV